MTFKVAVVQETPAFFDNRKSLKIVDDHLRDLAKENVQLVMFPESFLPGYPRDLDFGMQVGSRSERGRNLWLQYWKHSISCKDDNAKALATMAEKYQLFLAIGVTEKEEKSRSLYCSLLVFSPEGKLIYRHRKIKPTGMERVVWGEGDGSDISAADSQLGKLGGLICWENYMPEARLKLYRSGLDIYLAPTADARPTWTATMQHIAFESRCFVLSSNQYFTRSDYPEGLTEYLVPGAENIICRGGSCIVSPYGALMQGPLFDKKGVLIATIDHDELIRSRLDFDPSGHYSRPDILDQ